MKKIILILLLVSVSLSASKTVVLQLNWLNQFQFAGYYVAQELGFYKDVGIDVEIKELDSNTNISTVLEDKEADFAVGRSSLLIDKDQGKDVVAMGVPFQQSPMMLLVRDDSNISSISDFKDKRIMFTNDSKDTASIMAMLFSNGITQKDISITPHSFNLDDLINKKTDAMVAYVSNEPIRMKDKNIGYKIFHPKDYGFHFYSDILFTSSEFIKKNPKVTKDFYEATMKGWQYAFDNISQSAEIIYKHYNSQNKTLIQLIKEGEALKRCAFTEDGKIGYLDKHKLSDIVRVYKVLGLVTQDVDLEDFIYEYNHPKEVAFKLNYDEILHYIIISFLTLVVFGFGVLHLSLRNKWLHTQRYLNEKILQQKEEIEKQNRVIIVQSKIAAVAEMLSNIAHQWRQPLNVISLSTAKIETSILLGADMKNEDFLKINSEINSQAQYLSQTIDDFRNYFNSNTDTLVEFNIEDAINKVTELTKESFKSSEIELVLSLEDCDVLQNENLLIQALVNIYNNARDAIIEKAVSYKYLFIDVECDEKSITIILKDSGGGIDKDAIEKVFEPYFTTKHKTKGTGLGLYITYGIITRQLKGSISVQNREYDHKGHKLSGAEFIVKIPKEY